MRSFTWLLLVCPEGVGDGDLTVVPVGEKTEPLTVLATGVAVPDWLGEPGLPNVGRDVVDAKRFDSEAFERRYGRLDIDDNGDFPSLRLCTEMACSESDSCGDCSGSSGVGGISGGAWAAARGRGGGGSCV